LIVCVIATGGRVSRRSTLIGSIDDDAVRKTHYLEKLETSRQWSLTTSSDYNEC